MGQRFAASAISISAGIAGSEEIDAAAPMNNVANSGALTRRSNMCIRLRAPCGANKAAAIQLPAAL